MYIIHNFDEERIEKRTETTEEAKDYVRAVFARWVAMGEIDIEDMAYFLEGIESPLMEGGGYVIYEE